MFVSWTGYLFPWLPAESSWVGLHEPVCVKTLSTCRIEHGWFVFKALYWYFRSSLEQGPKSKRIFLNRVSYFRDYSLKQGQGFTVPAAHPHSITYGVPPPREIIILSYIHTVQCWSLQNIGGRAFWRNVVFVFVYVGTECKTNFSSHWGNKTLGSNPPTWLDVGSSGRVGGQSNPACINSRQNDSVSHLVSVKTDQIATGSQNTAWLTCTSNR